MSSAITAIARAFPPGHMVAGKYRVERVLGAGGMGVVLAAWDIALERRVALKLILPGTRELPDASARFLREARAAARLQSDHVARVLDLGALDGGAPYLVLEYLEGVDLDIARKARGPLLLAEAVDYLLQAGEAIAEAHALGIIHRDLKLKNLFVTRAADGGPRIKVLDFGLSKVLPRAGGSAGDASLTATSTIIGTIHTMAPEQLRGLRFADARSDLWALGVVLYELLAGRRPFEGESIPAISAAIMADTPAPLSSHRRDLPPELDAVVARCLAKDPAARFQSIGELASALSPFGSTRAHGSLAAIARLSGAAPPAPTPPPEQPATGAPAASASDRRATTAPSALTIHKRAARGDRTMVTTLIVMAIAALGSAAAGWVLWARPFGQRAPAATLARPAALEALAAAVEQAPQQQLAVQATQPEPSEVMPEEPAPEAERTPTPPPEESAAPAPPRAPSVRRPPPPPLLPREPPAPTPYPAELRRKWD